MHGNCGQPSLSLSIDADVSIMYRSVAGLRSADQPTRSSTSDRAPGTGTCGLLRQSVFVVSRKAGKSVANSARIGVIFIDNDAPRWSPGSPKLS
jgi:hypothetical protein